MFLFTGLLSEINQIILCSSQVFVIWEYILYKNRNVIHVFLIELLTVKSVNLWIRKGSKGNERGGKGCGGGG